MFNVLDAFKAKASKMRQFAVFSGKEWPSKSTYVEKKLLTTNEVNCCWKR
jgi:hypothetical protein